MVEFGATIKLDSVSATEQMRKFAEKTTAASKALVKFQNETKATTQGGGANVFRKYINSSQKANQQILKSIALIHDQRKAFSKLNDEQKELIAVADRLNLKYDESARAERKLVNIRKELRIVTAAGLKTQKEADVIYNREAESIRKSSRSYREKADAQKKAFEAGKRNLQAIREARVAHDKEFSINRKVASVKKQLILLLKNEKITRQQYNQILTESRMKITAVVRENHKLITSQQRMIKMARLVSVYSRLLLGAYAVIRAVRMFVDFEKTAEAVRLLNQKLEFLTGDTGAYKKLFTMTQEVGVTMESANKIITRFAVVTNRAFSIETMSEWSGTLIKSARATGTSTQEMTGALIQITQAMSAGRLMGDEYRSVTENLPLLTVALRDIFGRSTSSLKELSSQGLITNEVLIEAFGRTKELLQGFPDSTDTIEASFGRLSSSWDNLVSKMIDATITKDITNSFASMFISLGEMIDKNEISVANNRISLYESRLSDAKLALDSSLKISEAIKSQGRDASSHIKRVEERTKLVEEAERRLEEKREALRVILGTSKGDLEKKAADDRIQAIRKENEAYKQQLITLQFIDKLEGGKSIFTIKQNAALERSLLLQKQKLHNEAKPGGIAPEKFFDLADSIDKKEKIAIDKQIQKQIDGELRLAGFTTRNNIDKIEEELRTTGKILSIRKKLEKDLKSVESERQARIIGKDRKQSSDQLSDVTLKKAKRLTDSLKVKSLKDIKHHIDAITSSIESVNDAALVSTAKINDDLLGSLGLGKESIISDYERKLSALNIRVRQLGSAKEYLRATGNDLDADTKRWTDTLKKQAIALDKKKEDDFTSNLEQKFDAGAAAVRVYNKEIISLTVAKDRLNLSEFEHNRQLGLLNKAMQDQVNQSKSLRLELSGFEQTFLGMEKGMTDFRDSAKTAFETIAESTETMFDGMVDLIVDGSRSGADEFRKMTDSILKDIQKMIVKSLILKSVSAIGSMFDGGTTSTAGSVAQSVFAQAKGGTFSGAGISAYSNTVVDKPTVFPFAKGTGLMGEAGEEAIMPLTRLSNGDLGVGVAKGSGHSGDNNVTISVSIDQSGNVEQKTETSQNDGIDLGNILSNAVNQQLIKEMRPGGILNRSGN